MTARPQLTGLRMSEWARCARACALRGLGAIPTEPDDLTRRYFARGQLFETYVAHQFEARYGKDDIDRQAVVPWSVNGTTYEGHIDIVVKSEGLAVEVVSSTSPDGMFPLKVAQVKRYLRFRDDLKAGAVYVVNPSSLTDEQLYPVLLTDEDIREIDDELQEIREAIAGTGPLPRCPAKDPQECRRGYLCQFTDAAWQDWQPPDPLDLSDTPGLVALVADYYRADKEYKEAESHREVRWRDRNEAREALAELLPPGVEVTAGPFSVKRTAVKGRETFSWAKAKTAGVITPALEEQLWPFVKVGDGHSRITLKRVSDEPVPREWGEIPF